jgi:type IV pilus assembly protein PilF
MSTFYIKIRLFCCCSVFLWAASGCVTETSGGLPAPASLESRAQAQLDLAQGYLEQGDFARARIPLAKALEMDPKNAEVHVFYAFLFNRENEYELAESHYQQALKLEPRDAQALNNYGAFLYARGRYTDAVQTLSLLVQDTGYRARSQAFENLGLALLRSGDAVASEAAFIRSLELNFRQSTATLELAAMAYGRGDYAGAAARLLEYKTMARQSPRSLCLGIQVGTATGDIDQVSSNLLALNNLYPEQADKCQAKG